MCLLFSRDNEVTHLDITIGNNNIELKQYVKLLCINGDEKLDLLKHI